MSLSLRDQLLKAGLVNEKQAKQAVKQKQKQQRLEKKGQVEKDDSQRQAALQAQAEKLQSATVKLERTAGAEGRLFGAVQTADVAEAIEAAGLGSVDKRSITLPAHIKSVGNHEAQVRLHEDVIATVQLQVVAAKAKK